MDAPLSRLCIAATSGSSGKTLLSLGLGRVFRNRGIKVKPFKKGPDYIDAAWLAAACGRMTTNLDLFFMPEPELRSFFFQAMRGSDLALIEGNRGIYDGLDEQGSCSTAALARALACPVLLCLNCSKSTRTMAAVLRGILSFEDDLDFCGVILNSVGSARHEKTLRRIIETQSGLPVLGALPRMKTNPLPERHMGLASRGGIPGPEAEALLDELGGYVSQYCDVDAILAKTALPFPRPEPWPAPAPATGLRPRIGYVCDAALWFYYPENLQALENAGAELARLSLADDKDAPAWQNLSGLYLGGGFPEDLAPQISQSPWLGRIAGFAAAGMPIYAECGGLMLLCAGLERDGRLWPMSGVFPHIVKWQAKPQGLGYVEARVIADNAFFPKGRQLRGHEFHYSHCDMSGQPATFALELSRGAGLLKREKVWDAMLRDNVWASYLHIFAPAAPEWAANFVAAAARYARSCDNPA